MFIWVPETFGPRLYWLWVPHPAAIERVARAHLQLPADRRLSVTFFSEGCLNKLYTIAVSDDGGNFGSPQYIFRATSTIEPFYKTASEVATLSYLREHTSIPVPLVIAHCSTAENELGCEWILMEKVPGVALGDVWSETNLETKKGITRSTAGFVQQLRDIQRPFNAIGNLYFRGDIDTLNPAVPVVPTHDEKYVLGPIVSIYTCVSGRKLRVQRNLGPYSNDAEYISALIATEMKEMDLLLSADAGSDLDFDEDLAEDAEEIKEVLNKLQKISTTLFSARPARFSLHHQDLSLENIIVDPATYEITGIVDWECVGTRPHWEDNYPLFLIGEEVEGEVEPLAPGDRNSWRLEQQENREKMELRQVFDQEQSETRREDDKEDEVRREFKSQLGWVDILPTIVGRWVECQHEKIQSDSRKMEKNLFSYSSQLIAFFQSFFSLR